MVEDVGSLIERDVSASKRADFVEIGLNATIKVDAVVVKEKWVLRNIPKALLLRSPITVLVVVHVIKVSWLEVSSGLLGPHWVREVTNWPILEGHHGQDTCS